MKPLEFIQSSFAGGMNQMVDATRIGANEFPLLVNGRNRYDVIQTIKLPVQEVTLPMGNLQGIYAASNLAIAFVDGKAYYRDYGAPNSAFINIPDFQLSADAPTIWAELVFASTLNFKRIPASADKKSAVALTDTVSSTPQALVAQDGITQPWLITSDGKARKAHTYAEWTVDNREYLPIGRQMLFDNGILYLVSKDGLSLYRSVSGRPIDFMVNITPSTGDKPAATEDLGGAQTSSHRVGYNPITCLAPLNSPDNGFFVGTPLNAVKVVPDFNALVWGEPQFDNTPLFPTGPLNQFSFTDILGDSVFVDFTGARSFNAVQQFRYEGKNSPFTAKVFKLFQKIIQVNPCVGKFDNFALFSVNTVYGPGILFYDELSQSYVGLDIYPGLAAIKQFAEIKTTTFRKLLFATEDNKLYEAFVSGQTARLQLYAGEWCSNDPKIAQTGMVFKVVLIDAKESGTITVTPFVDREKQAPISHPVEASIPDNPLPLAIPYGVSDKSSSKIITFDVGRIHAGWKVGFLVEMDCDATISHLSFTSEQEPAVVGPSEEPSNISRLVEAGAPPPCPEPPPPQPPPVQGSGSEEPPPPPPPPLGPCDPPPVVAIDPPNGATVNFPTYVFLSVSRPDAAIYYTLDGSVPTAASTRYVRPFQIPAGTTVKARGIVTDCPPGDIATASYIAVADTIFLFGYSCVVTDQAGNFNDPSKGFAPNGSPQPDAHWRLRMKLAQPKIVKRLEVYQTTATGVWDTGQAWATDEFIHPDELHGASFHVYPLVVFDDGLNPNADYSTAHQINHEYRSTFGTYPVGNYLWTMVGQTFTSVSGYFKLRIFFGDNTIWETIIKSDCSDPVPPPPIVSITLDHSSGCAGDCLTVSWSSSNIVGNVVVTAHNGGTRVLYNGPGNMAGSIQDCPTVTTVYQITGSNAGGTATATALYTINPAVTANCDLSFAKNLHVQQYAQIGIGACFSGSACAKPVWNGDIPFNSPCDWDSGSLPDGTITLPTGECLAISVTIEANPPEGGGGRAWVLSLAVQGADTYVIWRGLKRCGDRPTGFYHRSSPHGATFDLGGCGSGPDTLEIIGL